MTGEATTEAREPRFDLLVKGGTVVDPAAATTATRLDIAVANGQIAAIAPAIPAEAARETIDATGTFVVPGLIDLHTHIYAGATYWGVELEPIASTSGVTTWVDAGSAGAFNMPAFVEQIVERVHPRVYAYLNISALGLTGHDHELANLEFCDIELCQRTAERYNDVIVGVKVRVGTPTVGPNGLEPLRRAREAAARSGLPLMVHIAVSPPAVEDVLALMRPGDVLTHCCTGQTMRLIDRSGQPLEAAHAARQAGVFMDVGHGAGSFSFETAEQLAAQGFWPDVISTDLHQLSQYGADAHFEPQRLIVRISAAEPSFDLPACMSKLLGLGMPFAEVVRATTETPARILGRLGAHGTLREGASADLCLLRIEEGPHTATDSHGHTRQLERRITCALTLCAGTPLHSTRRSTPPVWIDTPGHATAPGPVG